MCDWSKLEHSNWSESNYQEEFFWAKSDVFWLQFKGRRKGRYTLRISKQRASYTRGLSSREVTNYCRGVIAYWTKGSRRVIA